MTSFQLYPQNEMLQKLFLNSTEAIFFFDENGQAISLNPAAEKILNVDVLNQLKLGADDAICRVCKGYTSETELQTCLDCYLRTSSKGDFSSFQVYLDTVDRGVTPFAATFHTIDPENGIRVFMLRDLTAQFETQRKLNQNVLIKQIIEAQEKERKRISRELHDSIAQELLSAVIELRTLKYMTQDTTVLNKVEETQSTLSRLLDEIRSLSVELRPAALDDLGLEAAFRSHFKRMEETYGISVHFDTTINKSRYTSVIETVCYRICQEAILNAIKYAFVEDIFVELHEQEKYLLLRVQDHGQGFELGAQPKGTGLGLYGMRERTELINGKLTIDSKKGSGTTIQLTVPIQKEGE